MIKHIFNIIWTQRRSNGWIFAELLVVMATLWFMIDTLWVDILTYRTPMGFDITNTWRFKLGTLPSQAPGYIPDSLYASTPAEDLQRLMTQIRQDPKVEEVCVSFYSSPYGIGEMYGSVYPVGGDTAVFNGKAYHKRFVTPEYFDVFRVRDKEGRSIPEAIRKVTKPVVITAMGEEEFFPGQSAVGKQISMNSEQTDRLTVAAVSIPVKNLDYERAENCTFCLMDTKEVEGMMSMMGVSSANISVRMRQSMTEDEMYAMLSDMEERLTVNNLYIYGVSSTSKSRAAQLGFKESENNKKLSIMAFLLVNVFFGIVGTFWLRTQYRRGEIGLRVALGSSRGKLKEYMYLEGFILLALTLPLVILFSINMAYMDKLDSFRIPLTWIRFMVTFGVSYLLMAGMICIGIWFPVRKAVQMAPAEALHYE